MRPNKAGGAKGAGGYPISDARTRLIAKIHPQRKREA